MVEGFELSEPEGGGFPMRDFVMVGAVTPESARWCLCRSQCTFKLFLLFWLIFINWKDYRIWEVVKQKCARKIRKENFQEQKSDLNISAKNRVYIGI